YQNYKVLDPSGTARAFPIYFESGAPCHSPSAPTASGSSLDGTGYLYNYGADKEFIAPDGTKEYQAISGSFVFLKDANGNYMSRDLNGDVVDTLNRTVVTTNELGLATNYTVLTSSGSSTFRAVFTAGGVAVGTNFGVPSVAEYNRILPVLQRIELPNGTR